MNIDHPNNEGLHNLALVKWIFISNQELLKEIFKIINYKEEDEEIQI
jgi:hypothetical protein